MSFATTLQDAGRHSMRRLTIDSPATERPTRAPVAVAPPGPQRAGSPDGAGPWVACCERSGVVEIHDPRLLRPGHEAFCRALLEAAVVGFEANRGEIDLESATCRLEFGPGQFDRAELAGRAAGAIRAATPAVREGSGRRDGDRAGWTVLTAIACDGGASVREWSPDAPDDPICVAFPVERCDAFATARQSGHGRGFLRPGDRWGHPAGYPDAPLRHHDRPICGPRLAPDRAPAQEPALVRRDARRGGCRFRPESRLAVDVQDDRPGRALRRRVS